MSDTDKVVYKASLIKLAKHHNKTCDKTYCKISLSRILKTAENDGLVFTEEEKSIFI